MQDLKRVMSKIVTHEKTPIVLTIASCAGVIATGILTARAAPKATKIVEDLKSEADEEEIPFGEVVKATWKIYIPPVCMGLATMSTIIASDRVNARKSAILSASTALAAHTLREYQQHVLEEIGAERESKVRNKMAKNELARNPLPEDEANIFFAGGEGVLVCYDSLSGRYFKSNAEKIRSVENDINRDILSHMSVSLNDLYYQLGLEPIEVGDILGFNVDNMIDFHFSATLDPNKKPVLVIGYINMPIPDYDQTYPRQ